VTTDPPPRLAIWCAVSSKPQADRSSLADQEAAGRTFAAAVEGHVVRVYSVAHTRDIIFWSDAEAEMQAYRQLREDCQHHTFDVLWALDVDRLGRDPALSNQVISLVEKNGGEIYLASAPHPIGHVSTGQRYLYSIQSVRAKEDQDLRTYRLGQGIAARVRGGLPANHWPLGYRPIPGPDGAAATAEPDPGLAPAVELITSRFLAGEPYAAIVRALNASPYHPPRARRWTYSVVWKVVHNDVYAGVITWGDVQSPDPSPHFPHLWDPATHAAVIRERARRTQHPRDKSAGSPLAGVVFCGKCGYQLTRHKNRSGSYSLRCSKHNRASVTGEPCHPNHIPEQEVISALSAHLRDLVTPAALDEALVTLDLAAPLDDRLAEGDRRLADLATRRERLALTLAAGKMDPQIYRRADDLLLADVDVLNREHANLQTQLAAIPSIDDRRAALLALADLLPHLVTAAPSVRVRTLLQNAGLHVTVEAGAITSIDLT
jgi:DNA invertase Pin-like site-specific DNA recombinase